MTLLAMHINSICNIQNISHQLQQVYSSIAESQQSVVKIDLINNNILFNYFFNLKQHVIRTKLQRLRFTQQWLYNHVKNSIARDTDTKYRIITMMILFNSQTYVVSKMIYIFCNYTKSLESLGFQGRWLLSFITHHSHKISEITLLKRYV